MFHLGGRRVPDAQVVGIAVAFQRVAARQNRAAIRREEDAAHRRQMQTGAVGDDLPGPHFGGDPVGLAQRNFQAVPPDPAQLAGVLSAGEAIVAIGLLARQQAGLAVGGERDIGHGELLCLGPHQARLIGFEVPHQHHAVKSGANEVTAIGMKREVPDSPGVFARRGPRRVRGGVPEFDRSIGAGAGERLAIGGKDDAHDWRRVCVNAAEWFLVRPAKQRDDLVAPHRELPIVRRHVNPLIVKSSVSGSPGVTVSGSYCLTSLPAAMSS